MIARLLTVLVLLAAIGAVSWGMQADAEDDCDRTQGICPVLPLDPNLPVDERIAILEREIQALWIETRNAYELPAEAPRPESDWQFFNPDPVYVFEMSCRMEPYPLPGDGYFPLDVRMQCIRYLP